MKKQIILLTLILIAILISVSACSAATYTVGPGETYTDIQSAVTVASDGDTVNLTAGIFKGTGNKSIILDKSITIHGAGLNQTIIDCEGSGRAFTINTGKNVTIKDLTIRNGLNSSGGGGIYNNGNLTVTNCKFEQNAAPYGYGGAISNSGSLNVTRSTFTGNYANLYINGKGGAISNSGSLTITDSTFTGNRAYEGGTIFNNGNCNITGSNFEGNSGIFAAGVIWTEGGTCNINKCSFTGNTGPDVAGAIWIWPGICTITDSTFTGNRANGASFGYGGAIYNMGSLTVKGSTFTGNYAYKTGGAIENYGTCTVNFNRFAANTASSGSAIYSGAGSTDAENNWWGSNNPVFSSLIYGTSAPNQWLFMTINATPSTINNTQTSLITVSFNNYSTDGTNYTPLPTPLAGHIPDGTKVIFSLTNGPFGTLTAPLTVNTINGIASIVFTASQVGVQAVNGTLDNQNLTLSLTVNPAANLFINITSSNKNPKTGELFTLTYKLGNYGPDPAENITITIPLPEGFELVNVSGTGWTYNAATNTITWNLANVPVGDPYLYITGRLPEPGLYVFSASIFSDTYNINSEDVTPITINAVAVANAASEENTVGMQETGLPIAGLLLAVLALFGGLASSKRK